MASVVSARLHAIAIPNAGFEQGRAGQIPPRWRKGIGSGSAPVQASASYRVISDSKQPYRGARSARLELVGAKAPPGQFGSLVSSIDATALRGRRIRLTAAVRSNAPKAPLVGLWLRVDRSGGRIGFFDNMDKRPVHDSQWAKYAIEGDVSTDAVRIAFGGVLAGPGKMWVDDFRIEDIGPAKAVKVTPAQYVDEAIKLLRENHINSSGADWQRLTATAHQQITTAVEPADTYPAIRAVINALGEHHTMLLPPGGMTSSPVVMPTTRLVGGRFGVLHLPGFMGSPDQGTRYMRTLRSGLEVLDRRPVCGWVVDLRDDWGGNMWPMLNGLDPLLGKAPFGEFVEPSGKVTYWVRKHRTVTMGDAVADSAPAFKLRHDDAPVAVLLGPHTTSSGEMTAIALVGRPGARSFGTATGGYATSNVGFPLADNAALLITDAYVKNRLGYEYRGPIVPDQVTAESDAESAALQWLAEQPCH